MMGEEASLKMEEEPTDRTDEGAGESEGSKIDASKNEDDEG